VSKETSVILHILCGEKPAKSAVKNTGSPQCEIGKVISQGQAQQKTPRSFATPLKAGLRITKRGGYAREMLQGHPLMTCECRQVCGFNSTDKTVLFTTEIRPPLPVKIGKVYEARFRDCFVAALLARTFWIPHQVRNDKISEPRDCTPGQRPGLYTNARYGRSLCNPPAAGKLRGNDPPSHFVLWRAGKRVLGEHAVSPLQRTRFRLWLRRGRPETA
jgi:hypothetical protein